MVTHSSGVEPQSRRSAFLDNTIPQVLERFLIDYAGVSTAGIEIDKIQELCKEQGGTSRFWSCIKSLLYGTLD